MRPGKRRALDKSDTEDALTDRIERLRASIRVKVEHPFRILKQQFGYAKVRYRGPRKNTAQLMVLFTLTNLWLRATQIDGGAGVRAPRLGRTGLKSSGKPAAPIKEQLELR